MTDVVKKPCKPMVGADVEAFIFTADEYKYTPCVGIVAGTKEKPEPMEGLPKGFATQEDNVMVEWNIPPAATSKTFASNIKKAKDYVSDLLRPKYEVTYASSAMFTADQLTSPQARTIGCEPDFDAYEGGMMRRDIPPLTRWRGAGGHIHLGGDFQCPDFVAALFADVMLGMGLNLTGMNQCQRTKWYGQPGIYRPKPYGIEWRSPSSQWVADGNNTPAYVGDFAIRLAKWMTETDARELQATFRAIDWLGIRRYMTFENSPTRAGDRKKFIAQARRAGMPL